MTDKELFEDYYGEQEVAKLLGISVPGLRNRISAGRDHPPFIGKGSRRRFPRSEYKKWESKRLIHQANRAS